MGEWQPIETAPKDGTRVLVARFAPGTKYDKIMKVDRWQEKYSGFGLFNHTYWPPTHWMPLPAPPENT